MANQNKYLGILRIFCCTFLFAGSITVYGFTLPYDYEVTVLDEMGEPLIGVNVYTDDYSTFTGATDFNGKVVLNNLNFRDEVNFSYIGYQSVKLPFFEIRKSGGVIRMYPSLQEIIQVVVVGRRDDVSEEVPFVVNKISKTELAFTNPQTAADALRDHGGLFIQKSQMGGGSPIVRGFEANRVLLVLDGVRMNNAIYRNGHLQNSITVDNGILEQVEVINGPGSLIYGSEALGGVVHFRSKEPKLFRSTEDSPRNYIMETNVLTRYSSANNEKSAHVDVAYGSRNWGSLTSATYTDYGDLRAGSNRPEAYPNFGERRYFAARVEGVDQIIPNLEIVKGDTLTLYELQRKTEYTQVDLMQKLKFQPNNNLFFIANFQYSTSSDVPRYDNLTDTISSANELKFSEWYYGPQQRILASLKTRILKEQGAYDKATLIAAFQRIDEDRFSRKFAKALRTFNLEDVYVFSFTADFDKYMDQGERHLFAYGIDINHNIVKSQAGRINLYSGKRSLSEPTRYPSGGSTMTTYAAYMNYRWKSRDSVLNINAGLRYTHAELHALFGESDPIAWPEEYYTTGVGNKDGDLTWGLGFTFNIPGKWQLRLLSSSAFRSPNIDDFGKIRAKKGFVTIPNPDLDSERSVNGEITIAKEFGEIIRMGEDRSGSTFKLSVTGFYTALRDAIVRTNFPLPSGGNILLVDDEEYTTQSNINSAKGFVYGFSGNILLNIADSWKFQSGINFTRGRRSYISDKYSIPIDTLVPLDHIPPLYGQTGLSFKKGPIRLEVVARYNGAKPAEEYAVNKLSYDDAGHLIIQREGMADNIEYGLVEVVNDELVYKGSYGWITYNFYSSLELGNIFTLSLGLENIADVHYRPFASGISAPGRNLIVSLRGSF